MRQPPQDGDAGQQQDGQQFITAALSLSEVRDE
jgi:hypothetical protein